MKRAILFFCLLPACHSQHPITPVPSIKQLLPITQPDITYTTHHDLSPADAKTAAESLAKSLEKYGMKWSWQNNAINFEATTGILNGVHGTLKLQYSHVTIEIYDIPKFIPDSIVTQRVSGKMQVYFNID